MGRRVLHIVRRAVELVRLCVHANAHVRRHCRPSLGKAGVLPFAAAAPQGGVAVDCSRAGARGLGGAAAEGRVADVRVRLGAAVERDGVAGGRGVGRTYVPYDRAALVAERVSRPMRSARGAEARCYRHPRENILCLFP